MSWVLLRTFLPSKSDFTATWQYRRRVGMHCQQYRTNECYKSIWKVYDWGWEIEIRILLQYNCGYQLIYCHPLPSLWIKRDNDIFNRHFQFSANSWKFCNWNVLEQTKCCHVFFLFLLVRIAIYRVVHKYWICFIKLSCVYLLKTCLNILTECYFNQDERKCFNINESAVE